MADDTSSTLKTKPAQRKRRGRPPIAISPPKLYPIITLSVAQEHSPGESNDIANLAKAARLTVTSNETVQVQAARDLSFWIEDYTINSRLRAKRAPTGSLRNWASQIEWFAREFIRSLGGDADEALPFDPRGNDVAARALARALPTRDQRELRRQLSDLQARAGVAADRVRISAYGALVATVRHAGNGAAAILLLAKELQQSEEGLATISQRALRLKLFFRLGLIFEQLHPGKCFTVSSQESKPSGPTYRWVCALVRLVADRFGTVFPELAELNQWAKAHPSGVWMLIREIREAQQHGKNAPN